MLVFCPAGTDQGSGPDLEKANAWVLFSTQAVQLSRTGVNRFTGMVQGG